MKTKSILFALLSLYCYLPAGYTQTTSGELLQKTNFGTIADGINTTATLYPTITGTDAATVKSNYHQPPTRVFYNNAISNTSINPAVTIAPPLNQLPGANGTAYTFGFNETWYSSLYQFPLNSTSTNNTRIQIPMAPNNGYYVIATSTQGMYNAPTLAASSAAWYVIYDKYEVDKAHPTNYFLIVNGDPNPGKVFYQQSVTVQPGHIYRMSADLARLNTGSDANSAPNVAFRINNTSVYSTGAITTGGQWLTHTFDYVAPCGAGTIPITFSNNTSNTNGNDLALDNLSFKEILPRITMTADKDCSSTPRLPINFTLTAEIDVKTPGNYTVTWYKDGSPAAIKKTSNLGTDKTFVINSITTPDYAGNYYYTITTSGTTSCALKSPTITIDDVATNCNIPNITPEFDNLNARPGIATNDANLNTLLGLTNPTNILANDCPGSSCDPKNLQVLSFTINDAHIATSSHGTFQPGIPLVVKDTAGRTVGVLTLDSAGNINFLEAPDYPSASAGGIGAFDFSYKAIDTTTGAVGTTTDKVIFEPLTYTTSASCVGYPVRIVVNIDNGFLENDFEYAATDPNHNGTVLRGEIDDVYAGKINDAVATHFYLCNLNNNVKISDEEIRNGGGANIRRIDVVRTDNPADGGKIIFEFIATTPGIMTVQLRRKEIYANTTDTGASADPSLQSIQVQICPKTATWNGLESTEWHNNNNWTSEGLGAYPNWCTDVTIPGCRVETTTALDYLNNFPILNEGENNICRDIIFHMGASVGGIQHLTYRAAYADYQPPRIGNPGSTGKWTMIASPLKYIYSADYHPAQNWGDDAFTDIKSYMSYFDLAYETANKTNPDGARGTLAGAFSRPFAKLDEALTAGFGFASNVILTGNGGTVFTATADSMFYFPRYAGIGNAKAAELAGNTGFDMNETPYAYHQADGKWNSVFDFLDKRGVAKTTDDDWNSHFYTTAPVYYIFNSTATPSLKWTATNTETSTSYYGKPAITYNSPLPNPIVGQDSRFRFIYEDSSKYGYNPSAGTFNLSIGGTGATRIVGNPFLSHLKFSELYNGNSTKIQPYYRIWDGTSFYVYIVPDSGGYSPSVWEGMNNLTSDPNADGVIQNGYIAPMQAFFVDLKTVSDAPLTLNFTPAMSYGITGRTSNGYRLRDKGVNNENLLKLRLKMKGVETVTLLASLPNASDAYIEQEDIHKLFSDEKTTPEIYSVADKTAIEINAVSQQGEHKLIPLGIKTNQTGQFEISVEGAVDFTAYRYVQLLDALEDKTYDLKAKSTVTFSKTAAENLEGRFYIRLSNWENDDDNLIEFGYNNGNIRAYSSENIESFAVYDMLGRLYFQKTDINHFSYEWNPKNLKGVFLLKAKTAKTEKVQKMIF